jgi:PAS domain S-box-containing protein
MWNYQSEMIYCSPKAASLLGWNHDELFQKPIDLLKFVHEDDAADVVRLIDEISSGLEDHNENLNRNVTKDGRVIYCQWYNSALKNDDGEITSILSMFQDVTPQVETQLALKKSQQQLSLAFNSAIDPMWLIRVEGHNKFRFETINLAFTKVTGWTPEQVEGQPIENIMPATSHELVRGKYNEAIETGKIIDYVEEAQHPSGIKYGEIRVVPIFNEQGNTIRILGIANDISEKVHLQKKLDAEREIRSRYITSAAIKGQENERSKVSRELHDNVNQVLTTVKLYIELCLDKKVDVETMLPKCVTHLTSTINEIRSLSKRLSAPSLGNMNFKETLSDLVESVGSATQFSVTINFEQLSFLEMESELHLTLYRVVQEQLTNIIKYARASHVVISLKEELPVLCLSITDDGMGFDPSNKKTGIGITNMQSRVEILNGRFEIVSSIGQGTKLKVEIPVLVSDNVCYAEQTVLNPSIS